MGYTDPARQREYQNRWLKAKRRGSKGGEVRESARRARAKAAGAEGAGCPPGWEQRQLEAQGGLCYWCKGDITALVQEPTRMRTAYDADHIIPLGNGGKHEPKNLVLACRTCNGRRGGRQ
jgi:hypothetical protein